jgi:Right handed beta helix region
MKKILLSFILVLSVFVLSACGKEEKRNPNFEGKVVYEEGYKGWNLPGLYEQDGTPHVRKEAPVATGMSYDVTLFGAKPNDPNFDNTAAVKQAVENAVEGDEIYFPAGDYYFKTAALYSPYIAHINLKTGVNLRGESKESVRLISNHSEANNAKETAVISVVNSKNVLISDVTVTSIVSDDELPDPDVSTVNMLNYKGPKYGISIENTSPSDIVENIHVTNVLIEKIQRIGVRIKSAVDVYVTKSTFQKMLDLGGGGHGYGVEARSMGPGIDGTGTNFDTRFIVIEENNFVGPYLRHGALLQYYAHNSLITKNTFTGVLLDAIDLHGEDEYLNEVSYNTLNNTRAGAGIGVGNSGATHDKAGPGNYIHNNVIDGGRRGIDVVYGSDYTFVHNNTIKNLEQDKATGIFISDGPHTEVLNNTIENVRGIDSIALRIIYTFKWDDPAAGVPVVKVEGNTFKNNLQAIYVETHKDSSFKDNEFTDNDTDMVDASDSFNLPPRSDIFDPKTGQVLVAKQDSYVETGAKNANFGINTTMKMKGDAIVADYNRIVYMEFDTIDYNMDNYDKVYLRLAIKSKDGIPTVNIWYKEGLEWDETTITWMNAPYNYKDSMSAKLNDPNGEVSKFMDFVPVVFGESYNTYYLDVTDIMKEIENPNFTLIFTNELVETLYVEMRPHEHKVESEQPALIFVNE